MKKLAFILACMMLLASFAIFSAFADEDMVQITFRTSDGKKLLCDRGDYTPYSEMTIERERGYVLTDMDVPYLAIPIPCDFLWDWDVQPVGAVVNEDMVFTLVITYEEPDENSVTLTFRTSNAEPLLIHGASGQYCDRLDIRRERGHILTAEDYPQIRNTSSDIKYEWETDLIGTAINEDVVIMLNVTHDTPDNDIVTVTFRTSDGSDRLLDPNNYTHHSELTIVRERGHVLTIDDIPLLAIPTPFYFDYEWDVYPIGVAVYEDTVFTLIITYYEPEIFTVTFHDWDGNEFYRVEVQQYLGVIPPELEDKDGMMVTDWVNPDKVLDSTGYHMITADTDFYPVGMLRGDANKNGKLEVGDATLVLRAVVRLDNPGRNYDFNKNGRVDSGDAAGILCAVVGK